MQAVTDDSGVVLAALFEGGPLGPGTSFGTPADWPLQVGTLKHPAGHVIKPHRHSRVPGFDHQRQEVLVVLSGRLRCDIYDNGGSFREAVIVGPGSILMLMGGGHGVEFLEDTLVVEVKQGPYVADEKVPLDA